jgi:hypothetical protein
MEIKSLADDIQTVLARAAKDLHLVPSALRVEVHPYVETTTGYLVRLTVKDNRRRVHEVAVVVSRLACIPPITDKRQ